MDRHGAMVGFNWSPASVSEREMLRELTPGVKGTVLGDKGYLSERLRQELLAEGIVLQTPVRANRTDPLPSPRRTQLNRFRRQIETTIGQLTEPFHIQRTWARSMWSLTNRLNRKLLAHSLAVGFNQLDNRPPLQLSQLLTH